MENKTTKENTQNQGKHFGVVNLSIHYTLAAGLAEQLGDQVDQAVIAAISKFGSNDHQFCIDGAMIRMDQFWHRCSPEVNLSSNTERAVSVHLSNDLESDLSYSVDWLWF
jgi:hypothetical protein